MYRLKIPLYKTSSYDEQTPVCATRVSATQCRTAKRQMCVHTSTPRHGFDTCMWREAAGSFPWGKPTIDRIKFKDIRWSESLFAEFNYILLSETNQEQKVTTRSYRKFWNCYLPFSLSLSFVSNGKRIQLKVINSCVLVPHKLFMGCTKLNFFLSLSLLSAIRRITIDV
jgi:hypothetical protein